MFTKHPNIKEYTLFTDAHVTTPKLTIFSNTLKYHQRRNQLKYPDVFYQPPWIKVGNQQKKEQTPKETEHHFTE